MSITKAQAKQEYRSAFLAILASVIDDSNFDGSMEALADAFVDLTTTKITPNSVHVNNDYSAQSGDLVLVDATLQSIKITLPPAALDIEVDIKKIDPTPNHVGIVGGEIDGEAEGLFLLDKDTCVTLHCDGINWWIR